jgi:hypothetical protein
MHPATRGAIPASTAFDLAYSTAVTTSRVENPSDFTSSRVRNLQDALAPGIDIAVGAVERWISRRKIDAMILFNGRLDATAGALYACQRNGVPVLTFDRSLIGHGIYFVPNESCLSTQALESVTSEFRDLPLTSDQVRCAAGFLARRLLRRSRHEFRVFNEGGVPAAWPIQSSPKMRVLVLPSSRNELEGHDEWKSQFVDLPTVLPILLSKLQMIPQEVVIRGHPMWASRFAGQDISPASDFWRQYTSTHGYHFIDSSSRLSTQDLIAQADLIVVNGSSAALESGALGKKIICFGHSNYLTAGIATHIKNGSEWPRLEEVWHKIPEEIVRKTLRYAYCIGWRYPQFVPYVRADGPVRYSFHDGASGERIISMLQSGLVHADCADIDSSTQHEDEVIERFLDNTWQPLAEFEDDPITTPPIQVKRKLLLRWIDPLRAKMSKGDLL